MVKKTLEKWNEKENRLNLADYIVVNGGGGVVAVVVYQHCTA